MLDYWPSSELKTKDWYVAHRDFDSFGKPLQFGAKLLDIDPDVSWWLSGVEHKDREEYRTVLGNDAALFATLPVSYQGGWWDAEAALYAQNGGWYDPNNGRLAHDPSGRGEYAISPNAPDRDRVSLPTELDHSYGLIRGIVGDENLATASDSQLFWGTTALAAGVVAGGWALAGGGLTLGTAGTLGAGYFGSGTALGAMHGFLDARVAGSGFAMSTFSTGMGALAGLANPAGEFASFGGAVVGGTIEAARGGDFLGNGFLGGGLVGTVVGGFGSAARQGVLQAARRYAPEVGGIAVGAGVGYGLTGTTEGALLGANLGMFGGGIARGVAGGVNGLIRQHGSLRNAWADVAGEWRGWRKGFSDTGRYAWKGRNRMGAQHAQAMNANSFDELHHRVIAQGGTRGGAGRLTRRGFLGEQYGRYVPTFIKNSRWNITNMGQPQWLGGNGIHEALHRRNPLMRLNTFQRLWYGSNAWDKSIVAGAVFGGVAGIDYWMND